MKLSKLIVLIFLIGCSHPIDKQPKVNLDYQDQSNLPQISILGTFHFSNTTDYSAIIIDSLDSRKRQQEIKDIVSRLIKFKPTKVLVEREPTYADTLNQRLAAFKAEKYTLPSNELYQIGFRIARQLDHSHIYGIDYKLDLGDEELVDYLSREQLIDQFQSIINSAQSWANTHSEYLKKHTIGETLILLNNKDSEIFNKALYLDNILNITELGNSPASDYVANWWKRNIYIKKNIDDLISETDRVLVIIGAGHSSLLKEFYKNSLKVQYIDINKYLDTPSD